jgi:ribonuclease-3
MLAPRCERLVTVDVSPTAVGRARRRLAGHPNVEAIVGAVFLDGGYDAARSGILAAFGARMARLDPERPGKDAKTELQEVLQAAHRPLPLYRVVSVQGAAHRQSFEVQCVVEDLVASGTGASRQKAEQGAARAMLEKLTA